MSFAKWKNSSSAGPSSSSSAPTAHPDFTRNHLRSQDAYRLGHMRSLGIQGEITALAVDPVQSIMAIGTSTGLIHLVGSPAFQCTVQLSTLSAGSPNAGIVPVKFLVFMSGLGKLCCVDEKNTLHVWNTGTGGMDDTKNQPLKEITTSLYGDVTYVDHPSPAHSHLFFTLKDGITLAYDVPRRNLSPYKIENLWKQYEDRLRRSGVPGRFRGTGTPIAVCCAMNPRDLNTMLVGYEGGVIHWDMKERVAVNTFEMTLPPGAPGGSSYTDAEIWTERTPAVTSITWRPDGLVFAVGHEDGCISIWALQDADKPLMVRTLTKEDVNITDAESLFDAGALDQQGNGNQPAQPVTREPVFKLVWASFPDRLTLSTLGAIEQNLEPVEPSTKQYAEREETILVVLGGCLSNERPAINCLQMPVYQAPPTLKVTPLSPSEGLGITTRKAFRESLTVTGVSRYPTQTPAEDFILIPRSSPYFNLSHDPIALVTFLTPDEKLAQPNALHAKRSVEAWSFPPPRSGLPPEDTGRKNFHTTTDEALSGFAMAAVPTLLNDTRPRLATSESTASWRMPWSPSPASPGMSAFESTRVLSLPSKPTRPLRLPSIFWTGATNALGCEIYSLDNPTFRRLIAFGIEKSGSEAKPRLPLRGGLAVPDLHSTNAPEVAQVKIENYRIMATWHADGAIRFWDFSPHILVLPAPLRFEYPAPLPHLTISITNMLKHPSLRHLPISQLYKNNPRAFRVTGIDLATSTLECLIHVESGEVFIYKFGTTKERPSDHPSQEPGSAESDLSYFNEVHAEDAYDGYEDGDQVVESLTSTTHLANWKDDGFKPVTILTTRRGPVVATAMSDIGFFAVSYYANSVAIVDLRGPDVILREGFTEEGMKVKRKKKNSHNLPAEPTSCLTLRWAVCKTSGEAQRSPRLIASYAKGLTKLYMLNSVLGEWVVDSKIVTFTHESLVSPIASFLLSYATGDLMTATAEALRQSMSLQNSLGASPSKSDAKIPLTVWIVVAKRSIRAQLDFNGERIAKIDVAESDIIRSAHIVNKNSNKVLMTISHKGFAMFYTLPLLEFITTIDLTFGNRSRPLGRVSVDWKSGDYIEYVSPMEIFVRTVFNHRKPLLPRVDPASIKHTVPAAPVPLNATWGVSSWIWGGAPMTGVQLDALVAGPNRPGVPRPAPSFKPPKPLISWGAPADEKPYTPIKPTAPKRNPTTRDARERKDVYTEMTEAARERGDLLDGLEDKMMAIGTAAGDMLSEAKKTAAKQSAKATARGLFGF